MIQTKFIVGLMNQFDESVHRFNLLLGIDENDSKNKQCIEDFIHTEKKESKKRDLSNRNSYTKAKEGSPAWAMLSGINSLDVALFTFIEEQFIAQRHLFEQYQAKRIIFEQLETQRRVKTG
jgi:superfamily II DNA or RNA helicase